MTLEAHGIAIELPRSWSGRLFEVGNNGTATLHAGSFPVALHDGQFGDTSTGRMPAVGAFFALTEYRPGRGLAPGSGLFEPKRLPRPLDPARLAPTGLAHPRPGQEGMQHFFTASGRPFCLYVVIAGGRAARRHQLALVDHVLRSLRITARPG